MEGHVYTRVASADVLCQLLCAPPAPLCYIIMESPVRITFDHFSPPRHGWRPWDNGRAFGPEIEIRWQQVEQGLFQLLLLSEIPRKELLEKGWQEYKQVEVDKGSKVYLWGRHSSFLTGAGKKNRLDGWVQASIPRTLKYPLDAPEEFVYIDSVNYLSQGMVLFTRFRGLDGESRKEVER